MGRAFAICLLNDPVGTAIISVRHWQAGNCSPPLWRIVAVKDLVSVTTSPPRIFSFSKTLKYRGDLGTQLTRAHQKPFPLWSLFCLHTYPHPPSNIPKMSFLFLSPLHNPHTSFYYPGIYFILLSIFVFFTHSDSYLGEKSCCCFQDEWRERSCWVNVQRTQE